MHGARFEDGSIPLEILKDMAVLQEMIVEVAKWRFLEENPERKRSPQGFTKDIELRLSRIDGGSAVPVITVAYLMEQQPLIPPQEVEYLRQARDAVVAAIGAAERNESAAGHLPERYLTYFDRFMRSLRDDEYIELRTPTHTEPVRLTKETRRRIILESSSLREFSEQVVLRGYIPEADKDRRTFELQQIHGRKVRSPIPDQHFETILDVFDGYEQNVRVLIQGIGKLDRNSRLVRMESVEHISVLDPLDVPACLDEFRILKDGWLDGEGHPPRHDGLDWLAASFERYYPEPPDVPLPYVYPTVEGGVQMEWSLGSKEISLEVTLADHSAEWFWTDISDDNEYERTLDLNTPADWEWIAGQIRRLSETAA
ncbi:MAG: hypothetical protein OXG11_04250 [Chloroflexi bacterium]|nr:hypothetical protein [Chloroflexota bacterium]